MQNTIKMLGKPIEIHKIEITFAKSLHSQCIIFHMRKHADMNITKTITSAII
jgi:hypothetical protein